MSVIDSFSVLLPVYFRDDPSHLRAAVDSLLNQSRPASEIIIVEDGPLSKELVDVLREYYGSFNHFRRLHLEENSGLPTALNRGMEQASHEWIARMDADDICTSDRFEKQFAFLENHPDVDILSAAIDEYDLELETFFGRRSLPPTHEQILKYARWRSPFNHMAVVYRKSMLQTLGGYKAYLKSGQDYELWSRVLMAGYRSANLPDVVIKARTGDDFYGRRRRGRKHLKNEWRLTGELYKNGLIGWPTLWMHRLSKTVIRLLPGSWIKGIYRSMRSSS
jgi:glycosyltransferase involved in cell wall biosynthesis